MHGEDIDTYCDGQDLTGDADICVEAAEASVLKSTHSELAARKRRLEPESTGESGVVGGKKLRMTNDIVVTASESEVSNKTLLRQAESSFPVPSGIGTDS
jgi:hypothetical protein